MKTLPSLKKLVLTKVVASEADIARLKADHPAALVQWTQPDEATATKTKEQFQRFWDRQPRSVISDNATTPIQAPAAPVKK